MSISGLSVVDDDDDVDLDLRYTGMHSLIYLLTTYYRRTELRYLWLWFVYVYKKR